MTDKTKAEIRAVAQKCVQLTQDAFLTKTAVTAVEKEITALIEKVEKLPE